MAKRTALVTGASRGLGRAIADELESRGVRVLRPGRGELDLSSSDSVLAYAKKIAGESVDILVNNAGINTPQALEAVEPRVWAETLQVNLTGPFLLLQEISKGMKARRWGRVVNTSSVFSLVTREKRAVYTATKSALNGLTMTAAVELAPFGVLVNAVCPGYIDTELTRKNNSASEIEAIEKTIPQGRLGLPVDIAKLVAFLVSEDNAYMTGQMVVADGGFSLK